jgi:cytochrome oxidase assembly protein ShyY1
VSGGLQFDLEWRTTLFALVMVPALAGLGFWQMERAEEKSAIAAEFELKQTQAGVRLRELLDSSPEKMAYRRVTLTGRYREQQYFLLDNRMVQGRYGNEVLSIFETGGMPALALVNRGWIVADPARRSLPEAPDVEGEVTIQGQVYVQPGKPYVLEDMPLVASWPKRIQSVQMDKIAAALNVATEDIFPYPIRIDAEAEGALYADWPLVNVGPAKHYGYAVQWFAMSFVLAILFVLRSSNLLQLLRGRT